MGRRRRRIVKIVKKKLPSVFSCPSCGEEAIRVSMSRGRGHATVQCAACGLKEELEASPADQLVDVYCKFTDGFYGSHAAPPLKHDSTPTEAPAEGQAQVSAQEEPEGEAGGAGEGTDSEEIPQLPTEHPDEQEVPEAQAEEAEQPAEEEARADQPPT